MNKLEAEAPVVRVRDRIGEAGSDIHNVMSRDDLSHVLDDITR